MPDLPERADIDQLRRKARELLRAAVASEPEALARLHAVSERPTLAAAQLAIAREHGFRSWPALRSEAESRRQSADRQLREQLRAGTGRPAAQDITLGRWSFGGASPIETAAGKLYPGVLAAGPDHAALEAALMPTGQIQDRLAGPPIGRLSNSARAARGEAIRDLAKAIIAAVALTDDQGTTCALHVADIQHYPDPSQERGQVSLRMVVDPVPARARGWLELRGQDGSAARLAPSARPDARVTGLVPVPEDPAGQQLRTMARWILWRYLDKAMREDPDLLKRGCRDVLARTARLQEGELADGASPLAGQLTRLCRALIRQRPPSGLPSGWHSVLNAADRTDGPRLQLDLDTALPPLDGTAVHLNTLASWPGLWDLYLQAAPGWWTYSTDGHHKRDAMTVFAEDDLGGLYISGGGGDHARSGYEDVKLTFRPPLAPRASLLALTFASETQHVTAEIPLAP